MARDLYAVVDPKTGIEETPPHVNGLRRDLAFEVTALKAKLMKAGLVQTFHQMDRVTRMIGYEIEALETKKWPVTDLSFLDQP